MANEPKELSQERQDLLRLLKDHAVKEGPFKPIFGKLHQVLVATGAAGTIDAADGTGAVERLAEPAEAGAATA